DQMEMTGMPRGLYYMWDEENQMTEMAAAIPITPIPEEGRPKKTVDIGPGKAAVYDNYLVYDYYGNYDDMLPAHNGLEKAYEEVFKQTLLCHKRTHFWQLRVNNVHRIDIEQSLLFLHFRIQRHI